MFYLIPSCVQTNLGLYNTDFNINEIFQFRALENHECAFVLSGVIEYRVNL